jgi:hypothetical protein
MELGEEGRWLPFVPRLIVNRQRELKSGSNCGSIMGPISVASDCFPLSNALIRFAKLCKLLQF